MQQVPNKIQSKQENSSIRQEKTCSKPQTKPKASKRIAATGRKNNAASLKQNPKTSKRIAASGRKNLQQVPNKAQSKQENSSGR